MTTDTHHLTDRQIVNAILRRDFSVTENILYGEYYPLFSAIYSKYYTDYETPRELIDEIYAYLLFPKEGTGLCKLESFGFRCSFAMWLKIVTENYCRQLYRRRPPADENIRAEGDRIDLGNESFNSAIRNLDMEDVHKIIAMMPNQRYRKLIKYRYLEGKTNEETAFLLNMAMPNYYNKHKLAKAQYCEMLRKEGLL